MKKIFFWGCLFLGCFVLLASCGISTQNVTQTETTISTGFILTTTTASIETTLFTVPEGWTGDIEYEYSKHQAVYYGIPGFFSNLVDGYEYSYWLGREKPIFDDFHEMALVQFIKRFDIPKEKFEEVVKKHDQGSLEAGFVADGQKRYNADIIYTFDNELISEYYRAHDDEGNPIYWDSPSCS